MTTPPHSSAANGPPSQSLGLADGLHELGLTPEQLYPRYVSLGGTGTVQQLREHLTADACPDNDDHNVIAQALNDMFVDRGQDHPVAYGHRISPL